MRAPPNADSRIEVHLWMSPASLRPTLSDNAKGSTGTTKFWSRISVKTDTLTTSVMKVFDDLKLETISVGSSAYSNSTTAWYATISECLMEYCSELRRKARHLLQSMRIGYDIIVVHSSNLDLAGARSSARSKAHNASFAECHGWKNTPNIRSLA